MSDPENWQRGITETIARKNKARNDAARAAQAEQEAFMKSYDQACDIMQRTPLKAFQEFGEFVLSQGESAEVTNSYEDTEGPWVDVEVSDAAGPLVNIRFQILIDSGYTRTVWKHSYGNRRGFEQEEQVQSGESGPSKQYLLEELARHYKEASRRER